MKRSGPPERKTPLKRSGPSRAIKQQGGAARARQMRERAGIPEDGPRNANGESCIEKVCAVCGDPFLAVRAQAFRRKVCSIKCSAELRRRQSAGKRRGAANPNHRHGRRAGVRDRAGEARWYAALGRKCEHPDCEGIDRTLILHHVCYRQHVERAGGDRWAPENALTLCNACHSSHHQRGRRVIPLTALSAANLRFVAELLGGARGTDYLRRRYKGDDPRLHVLEREYPRPEQEAVPA